MKTLREASLMFNVQKFYNSHEIYINYNEYIKEEEDDSVATLEHMVEDDDIKEFKGIIDLITVKSLSKKETEKIKKMHDLLRNGCHVDLDVVSDSKKVLEEIKKVIPDVSVKLIKIH